MKIKYLSIISIFFLLSFSFSASAFYDTAANVMQGGSPMQGGDLEIRVYDSAFGGTEVCSQSFTNAINNGMWSVYMSNCNGNLFYGSQYHKEYRVNGNLIEFDGSERLSFTSRYGRFSDTTVEGDLSVEGWIRQFSGSLLWSSENFVAGTDLTVSYDSEDKPTLSHSDTSSQGNVATGGATVINDIDVDGRGHLTNMNTENRKLSDWDAPTGTINMNDQHMENLRELELQDWDDDGGGSDNSVRLLRRDDNWMFYDGGVVIGSYSNNNLGAIGDGNLRVKNNIGANAYYYESDAELKEDVTPIRSPLSTILSLQGVGFNWKDDGSASIGFIAQDVREVVPEIVSEVSSDSDVLSVDYARMTPILVEAVKEQQSQIESMGNRIDEQQEEIDELRLMIQELQ